MMNEPQRVTLESAKETPVDEEFSVQECAVQKRSDSKKSTDDETSYTSGMSDSTADDLTSGLSQDIKPMNSKPININNNINNNNNNNNNPINILNNSLNSSNGNINGKQLADRSVADFSLTEQTTHQITSNFSLGSDLKTLNQNKVQLQQQQQQQQQQIAHQQYIQQQQNLQQLLQAQKIQNPGLNSTSVYSMSSFSNLKSQSQQLVQPQVQPQSPSQQQKLQSQSQSQPQQQPSSMHLQTQQKVPQSQQAQIFSREPTPNNSAKPLNPLPTNIGEMLIQQSHSYYNMNNQQQKTQNQLITPTPPPLQQPQQSQSHLATLSQHSLTKSKPQLQPQPVQKNLNSHYSSSVQINGSDPKSPTLTTTAPQQSQPTIQQNKSQTSLPANPSMSLSQQVADPGIKKTNSYYSLISEANAYTQQKPLVNTTTSQPPPQTEQQQQQQQQLPMHPPSQSVPPILPNYNNNTKQTPSTNDQQQFAIKKVNLSEKARSFSEYKAYLDYLKNGAPQRRFEIPTQMEVAKQSVQHQMPKDQTIVRQYNPKEGVLMINKTNNIMNVSTSNIGLNSMNSMNSMNSINSINSIATNHNHNNSKSNINISNNVNHTKLNNMINKPTYMYSHPNPQQSYSHHTHASLQPNMNMNINNSSRLKGPSMNNNGHMYTSKSNQLIQPSFSTFSFGTNQNYMPNKSNYYPSISQRIVKNNYPGYYQGY